MPQARFIQADQSNHENPDQSISSFRYALSRMRADIRLAIVTLYCACSFGIIMPFAIYRLAVGDTLIGLVDIAIVGLFVSLMVLAWMPGMSRLAANITACAASTAVLAVVLVLGLSFLWVFSSLVGNFLMADRRIALITSTLLILGVAIQSQAFVSNTERFTFIAVASMVSLFSLIFSARVDTQHGQLTEIAARDGLTGAFNRRTLDQDLATLTASSATKPQPKCLAIMDLDNFKQLNDEHGHEIGDQVLVQLTEIATTSTRGNDRFYRYGGEEFVLILPGTGLDGARVALANLRERIAKQLSGPDGPVTVSIGLAEYKQGERPEHWLKRADNALLQAKRTGKDQLVEACAVAV